MKMDKKGADVGSEKTHFGYQDVSWDKKQGLVNEVFDSVAGNYDLMNDLMSAGMHRLWKRFVVDMAAVRRGYKILDLAGGTGDLTQAFAKQVGDDGRVVLADINPHMLAEGQKRVDAKGLFNRVDICQLNAESLPFPDNHFDRMTIGFGLRNVRDKQKALGEMHRVLKPGGFMMVLEFSKPTTKPLAKIYDLYSFSLLPKIGKVVAKDEDSYRYLAESIRKHPDQETLKNMMLEAGCSSVDYHNLTGGIVAVHRGFKA